MTCADCRETVEDFMPEGLCPDCQQEWDDEWEGDE